MSFVERNGQPSELPLQIRTLVSFSDSYRNISQITGRSLSSLLSLHMANSNAETPTQDKYGSGLSVYGTLNSTWHCLVFSIPQYHEITDVLSRQLFSKA